MGAPARSRSGRTTPARRCSSSPSVDDTAAYMPLQGFTTADLGYERGQRGLEHRAPSSTRPPMTRAVPPARSTRSGTTPTQLDDVTADGLRPHRKRLRRELPAADLLPDPVQPVQPSSSKTSARTCCRTTAPATRTPQIWKSALQLPDGRRDRRSSTSWRPTTAASWPTASAWARHSLRLRSSSTTSCATSPCWSSRRRSSPTTGRTTTPT